MQTIINWTPRPVVVTDNDGNRLTVRPGRSILFNGDLSDHPWVKNKWLEIGTGNDTDDRDTDDGDDLEAIRQRYQNIFGKKPHGNASGARLLQEIDNWREQQD